MSASSLYSNETMSILSEVTQTLVDLLMNRYTAKDGFLNLHVDVETGSVITHNHNLGDLGDYAQYVSFLGRELNQEGWTRWAINQGEKAPQKLSSEKINQISPIPGSAFWRYNNLSGDYIWGLSSLYLIHETESLRKNISDYCKAINKYSLLSNGMISYGGITLGKSFSSKIPLSNGLITGQLIEPLIHIYKKNKDPFFLDQAIRYLSPWITKEGVKYFVQGKYQSSNPLTSLAYSLRNSLKGIRPPSYYFGKGNIFLAAALLEAIEVAPELEYLPAINGWRKKYKEILNTTNSTIDEDGLTITPFQMIDLISGMEILIELYRMFNKEEDYILLQQTNHIIDNHYTQDGLIRKSLESQIAHIDHQTDMVINYLKLEEVDPNNGWQNLAEKLIQATLKYFTAPFGLYEQINIESKKAHTNKCNTKYFGLFLKIHILYNHKLNGGSIFEDLIIRNLATDR